MFNPLLGISAMSKAKVNVIELLQNEETRKPGSREKKLAVLRIGENGYGIGKLFLGVNYNEDLDEWLMFNGTCLELEDNDILLWCRVETFVDWLTHEMREKALEHLKAVVKVEAPKKLASFEHNGTLKVATTSASNPATLKGGTGAEILKQLVAEIPVLKNTPIKPVEKPAAPVPAKAAPEPVKAAPAVVEAPKVEPVAPEAEAPKVEAESSIKVTFRGVHPKERMVDFICPSCESCMEAPVKATHVRKTDKVTTYHIKCPVCGEDIQGELRSPQVKALTVESSKVT